MIFGNLADIKRYHFLNSAIQKCFDYIKENDLSQYTPGSYPIDGENVFVNIVEYETKKPEERFWEAHKKYLDLHYIMEGPEGIDLNFIDNMQIKDYVEEDDFLPLAGECNSSLTLNTGDFLICYPEDGHMTALVQNRSSNKVKKAIFKINLDLLA